MGTEVITYSRIGKQDIRFGTGTFEVVLGDGRKVIMDEVDLGAILNDPTLSSPAYTQVFLVDNYPSIQACFDAAVAAQVATVVFTGKAYTTADDLVIAPVSGQVHINVIGLGGVGANGCRITYTGSGTALTIKNNTRYTFENIRLVNGGSGSVGLHLTSVDVGSNHGPATYTNVFVTGFTTNIQLGTTDNKAASEIMFIQCETTSATKGVLIQGVTSGTSFTTGIRFIGLHASSCTDVLVVAGDNTGTQPKVSVWGFSFSNNTREFDFQVPGVYDIASGYTESSGAAQFLRSGSATATLNSAYVTNISVKSVTTNYPSSPSNWVALCHQPGHYLFEGNTLQTGSIQLGGYDGGGAARKSTLEIKATTIASASAVVAFKASSNTVWSVSIRRCGTTNTEAQNMMEDRDYTILTDGTEVTLMNYGPFHMVN